MHVGGRVSNGNQCSFPKYQTHTSISGEIDTSWTKATPGVGLMEANVVLKSVLIVALALFFLGEKWCFHSVLLAQIAL